MESQVGTQALLSISYCSIKKKSKKTPHLISESIRKKNVGMYNHQRIKKHDLKWENQVMSSPQYNVKLDYIDYSLQIYT